MTRPAIGSAAAATLLVLSAAFAVHEGRRFAADVQCERGLRRFRSGRAEAALEAYDLAVAMDSRSIEARYRRGSAQATMGSLAAGGADREQTRRFFERAAEDLEVVHDAAPHYSSVEFRLGVVRAGQGRDADAVPLLREAMRRDPNTPDGWRVLASSLLAVGAAEESSRAADEAARRDPWNADVHVVAANAEKACGRTDEAIARLRDAESCVPRDPVLRLLRADWLSVAGRTSEAMDEAFIGAFRGGASAFSALKAFGSRHASDARISLISAVAHRVAGDREAALALYDDWAQRSTAESRQIEALQWARAGDWARASARFASFEEEVMARLAPEFVPDRVRAFALGKGELPECRAPETRRRLAGALARFGRDDLALPFLEEAVRNDGERSLVRLVLAETYARLDRLDEARVHAQECLRRGFANSRYDEDPEIAEAALAEQSIGLRLFGLSHRPEEIERALGRGPRDPHAHYRAGLARLAAGDRAAADRFFEATVRLDPEDLLAVSHLEGRAAYASARTAAVRALGVRAMRLLAAIDERRGDLDEARAQAAFAEAEALGVGVETGAPLSLDNRSIDVGSREARPFLGRGFDSDERLGDGSFAAWWVGREAEIVVDLTRPAQSVTLRLSAMDLAPLVQEVTVSIGGARLARFGIGSEPTDHRCDLGGERSGRVRIRLDARLAISPWEQSGGRVFDRRLLAAALSRVTFD